MRGVTARRLRAVGACTKYWRLDLSRLGLPFAVATALASRARISSILLASCIHPHRHLQPAASISSASSPPLPPSSPPPSPPPSIASSYSSRNTYGRRHLLHFHLLHLYLLRLDLRRCLGLRGLNISNFITLAVVSSLPSSPPARSSLPPFLRRCRLSRHQHLIHLHHLLRCLELRGRRISFQ